MKLRNKKTGEIKEVEPITIGGFRSLAELNEEWEDYEEPEEYWHIDADGEVLCEPSDNRCEFDNNCREIGNYFESKEEAEKAVEKLKTWKRLKDKGFRFIEVWLDNNDDFIIKAKLGHVGLIDQPDVHLLFGGEDGE